MKKIMIALMLFVFSTVFGGELLLNGHWWKVKAAKHAGSFWQVDKENKVIRLEYPVVKEGDWDFLRCNVKTQDWTDKTTISFDVKAVSDKPLPSRHLGVMLVASGSGNEQAYSRIGEVEPGKVQRITLDLNKLKPAVRKGVKSIAFYIWHADFRRAGFEPGKDKVIFEISNFEVK